MARRRGKRAWHSTVFVVGVGAAVAGLAWLAWRRRGGGTSAALLDGAGGLIDDVLGGGGGSSDTGVFLDTPTQQQPIGGGVITRRPPPPTLEEVRRLVDQERNNPNPTKVYTGGTKQFYSPTGPGRAVPIEIPPPTTTASAPRPIRRSLVAR